MMEKPKKITVCNLMCLVMANGEIISGGISFGFKFKELRQFLTEIKEPKPVKKQ